MSYPHKDRLESLRGRHALSVRGRARKLADAAHENGIEAGRRADAQPELRDDKLEPVKAGVGSAGRVVAVQADRLDYKGINANSGVLSRRKFCQHEVGKVRCAIGLGQKHAAIWNVLVSKRLSA